MREFFEFNFERYEDQKLPTLDSLGILGDNIIYLKTQQRNNIDKDSNKKQQSDNIIYLSKLNKKL